MKIILFFVALIGAFTNLAQEQKNILYLDHWTDTLLPATNGGIRFNAVVGFQYKGDNYAVIGSNQGAHIIQVVEDELQFVDYVPGKFQSITVENRDYAVYQHYLYASCDEGNSSLQIIDISHLPDSVSLIYDSNSLFMTAHTLCTDTLNAKLYACGTNTAAMKIIDLTDPMNPTLETDFTSVAYVHDCHVVNDTAFLNCGYDGLRIYDFSGSAPISLGILDFYAHQGYNHSGYLANSRKQYAFTDETEGTKIRLCYLENYADISVSQEFGTSDFSDNIPHEIVLLENLLFCAYYNEGLRVYDLTTTPISEVGVYDTYSQSSTFKMNGAWGLTLIENENLILVSDRQSGLFLFRFPIRELEHGSPSGTLMTNIPFIDENRIIIPRDHLKKENLKFSIHSSSGSLVFDQQNFLNWLEIPLDLAAGSYIFSVFDDENVLLESGKFVIGN